MLCAIICHVLYIAVAGGMMIAASYSLVLEGVGFDLEQPIISGDKP